MTAGLEILPCAGEDYHRIVNGPKWTVAALNNANTDYLILATGEISRGVSPTIRNQIIRRTT